MAILKKRTEDYNPQVKAIIQLGDLSEGLAGTEAKYVTYFKQTDLPGYAIIKIDENTMGINLEYYAAFGEKPYDIIDLQQLVNP